MARMTGGEALVGQLAREGVRVIFGLPGVQLYGTIAALRDAGSIRLVTTRHEQATSYMADGYARASGAFGTALVVPGPGLLNASSGLSTAYACSSPVLMISGQVPRASLGKRVGVLHEVDDQLEAIAPVTKWRRRVLEVRDIPATVHEAVRQLVTGRPRPVEIEVPPDTMEEEGEATLLPADHPAREAAAAEDVERAAALLQAAERPVIYAGGGVLLSGAHEALAALAHYLQAGVMTSAEGKGAVSDDDEVSLGASLAWRGPLRDCLLSADLILAVGTRFALAAPRAEQQVVQIDVDPDEVGRNHAKTLGLVGDARRTLEALLERLRATVPARSSRKSEREALRAAAAETMQEPSASFIRALRAATPEETIVVAGMTQVGYQARPFWPVYRPRTFLTSSYSGNLGFAFPTALGAKVACPDRPVLAICGDGGFMYNVQELATAAQHGIGVVTVVFNDSAYGNVARDLDEAWGGSYAAELRNPDFLRLAEAFGVLGWRATSPAEAGDLVRRALEAGGPALVEVPVGRFPRPTIFTPRRRPTKYQQRGA